MFVGAAERREHLSHGVLRDQERRHRRRTGGHLLDDDELVAHVADSADVRRRTDRQRADACERAVELVVKLLSLVERSRAVGWRDLGDEPAHGRSQLGALGRVSKGIRHGRKLGGRSQLSVPPTRKPAGMFAAPATCPRTRCRSPH